MFYPTKYAEDPTVRPFALAIHDQLVNIRSLIMEAVNQGEKIPFSKANKVSLMSLFKLRETFNSILLLALNGCVRDASVLLLTLIELKLDVKYIGCDESRADRWLKHSQMERKPWKVGNLITELYPDTSEREASTYIYRYYSAIKHANPAAGPDSLPLGVINGWLGFNDEQDNANFVAITLFGTGSEGIEIVDSAINTFMLGGFSLKSFHESLMTSNESLKRLYSEHVRQMLHALLKQNT